MRDYVLIPNPFPLNPSRYYCEKCIPTMEIAGMNVELVCADDFMWSNGGIQNFESWGNRVICCDCFYLLQRKESCLKNHA